MADPSSKGAELQRTYNLTIKVHDFTGAATATGVPVQLRLVRADGGSTAPLFGPQGLVAGTTGVMDRAEEPAAPPMIEEGTATFRLLPNAYYFVPTLYAASVGGRNYRFTMPAADSDLIELLNGEVVPAGGIDGVTGLPHGSTALDSLRWDATTNRWVPVSSDSTVYYAITRGNTFLSLSTALRGLLMSMSAVRYDGVGQSYATSNSALNVYEVEDARLTALWPTGHPAPYLWVVVPERGGPVARYAVAMTDGDGGGLTVASFTEAAFSLTIEGAPYRCGVIQLVRDPRGDFRVVWRYTPPGITVPTIVQVGG